MDTDKIVQERLEGNTGPIQGELDFKKYNKLVVCGCSVSDRTQTKYCYGDYLSASLGLEYLHLAGGAGSDKRGFRLLVQAIQSGEVDEGSLVLFQPTEVVRREMPSHVTEQYYADHIADVNEKNMRHEGAAAILDKTLTGQIVTRFKIDSCHWLPSGKDKEMAIAYQEKPGCLNYDYDSEMLSVYWYMLQGLCDSKDITLVLLEDNVRGWPSVIFGKHGDAIKSEWYNKTNWINFMDFMNEEERFTIYALNPPHDRVHLNDAGHVRVADALQKILTEKGILQ